jgi:hypothetical protein
MSCAFSENTSIPRASSSGERRCGPIVNPLKFLPDKEIDLELS